MLTLGTYPSPVSLISSLSTPGTELWVKQDGAINSEYGGNKVRKLERLLHDARCKGARNIVTVGAIGSNHVLATGIFAKQLGIRVTAVVVQQPSTDHVLDNLRADIAQDIELIAAPTYVHAACSIVGRIARGAYYIPAGGSNVLGASGFVEAAKELENQVRAGQLPEPDLIVVALGSGGTVAGLLAGLAQTELHTRVLAVTVAAPPWLVECRARLLALRCAPAKVRSNVLTRLTHERRFLGAGYGHATELGIQAMALGAGVGLTLEQTYTAKTFAAALDRVNLGNEHTILYWHTLSSTPMTPLLAVAPPLENVNSRLLRLAKI